MYFETFFETFLDGHSQIEHTLVWYASETSHISSFVPCCHCTGPPFVAVSNVVKLSFCECQDFRKYMFSKCDSLNSILCRFFRDSYEEDKKSFEKTVTNIKTDIDCLFGLISSLDMQDKVTIFKSFSWTLY